MVLGQRELQHSRSPWAEQAELPRSHAAMTFTFGLNYGGFGLHLSQQLESKKTSPPTPSTWGK